MARASRKPSLGGTYVDAVVEMKLATQYEIARCVKCLLDALLQASTGQQL